MKCQLMKLDELYIKILEKAINFVSYKPRSVREVLTRINQYLSKSHSTELVEKDKETIIDNVIARLTELGYLDDIHFAVSYVQSCNISHNKPFSKIRMRNFLSKKGISSEIITTALSQYSQESEQEAAHSLAQRKFNQLKNKHLSSLTLKTKVIKYLLTNGFAYDIARTVVDTIMNKV